MKRCNKLAEVGRRQFLTGAVIAAAGHAGCSSLPGKARAAGFGACGLSFQQAGECCRSQTQRTAGSSYPMKKHQACC